jgi:hypothetical protein
VYRVVSLSISFAWVWQSQIPLAMSQRDSLVSAASWRGRRWAAVM